jgi:hypothetical protein
MSFKIAFIKYNVKNLLYSLIFILFITMRKILAIVGAIIAGGLGITLLNTAQEAAARLSLN